MAKSELFLSTPSARRATPAEWRIYRRCGISIHALREEGDDDRRTLTAILAQFLSTPSARRATTAQLKKRQTIRISIHALREEGDLRQAFQVQKYYISIHALREEGDYTAA